EARLLDQLADAVMESLAVACLELCPWDSLGRILRVQVERKPLHLGAEPAPEPVDPLEADVAERSNVVAPDQDGVVGHVRHCARGRRISHPPRRADGRNGETRGTNGPPLPTRFMRAVR